MDFLKKLGIYKLVLFSLSTLAVLIALVYFVISLSKPIYSPLYNDLTQQDQNIVTLKLQSMGINYQVGAKNSQILVPADKVLSLRMYFAQKGLITSGNLVGYEIFDKENGLSSSQFLNNVNALRALEGELSRTINSLSQVENSRVHLVYQRKSCFLNQVLRHQHLLC